MEKEKLLSKFNIKDYNKELEEKLLSKTYSAETKNLLINMMYKIENSYEDYKKVKTVKIQKQDILSEMVSIIEKKCEIIEIIKTQDEDKSIVISEEKIRTLPNEYKMMYSLLKLKDDKIKLNKKYDIQKLSLEEILNEGDVLNLSEVIRDFDGWAWNINKNEITNLDYNFIYQTLLFILNTDTLEKNISLDKWEEKLKKFIDEESANKIIELISRFAILLFTNVNKEEKKKLLSRKKALQIEIKQMSNKQEYLKNLSNEKAKLRQEIKKIDTILNDNKMIRKEFALCEEKIRGEIFSLSDFAEKLQKQRDEKIKKIKVIDEKMKPEIFVKSLDEKIKNLALLVDLGYNKKCTEEKIINLRYEIIKKSLYIAKKRITTFTNKNDIIEFIFRLRYYKLIPIDFQYTNDINEEFEKLEKKAITIACKLRGINIISNDIEENANIIKEFLNLGIINLEEIELKIEEKDNQFIINIYNEKTFEKKLYYNQIKKLNIKKNRKIKLFI